MRPFLISLAFAALPALAVAQPAPPAGPGQSADRNIQPITRDQFVQRAAETAGRRFDAIDTSHSGTITRAQIRAFRETHGIGNGPVE